MLTPEQQRQLKALLDKEYFPLRHVANLFLCEVIGRTDVEEGDVAAFNEAESSAREAFLRTLSEKY